MTARIHTVYSLATRQDGPLYRADRKGKPGVDGPRRVKGYFIGLRSRVGAAALHAAARTG